MSYIGIVLTFVFVNNIVLSQFLGLCPFFGVTTRFDSAVGFGIAVTTVPTLAALLTWAIQHFLLLPLGLEVLQILVFVLASAGIAQLLQVFVQSVMQRSFAAIYLPAVTANCAVFGVVLIAARGNYGPLQSLFAGLAAGAGVLLAAVLLTGIRRQLEREWVPAPFRGLPITLISAGLMSLAFMAFDHLFLRNLVG